MRLLVDVDGTLRHVWPKVNEVARTLTDVEIPDVWPTYDTLRMVAGNDVATEAFARVCGAFDGDDDWYEGAWDAMRALAEGGVEPVFCTLNTVRRRNTIERALMLASGMPCRVERVTDSANKIKVARRLGAVGIVDDKPDTLWAFKHAGLFTATINHPYNAYPPVDYRFDDWRHADLLSAVRDFAAYAEREATA